MPNNDNTASAIPQVYTAINRVQASLASEGITKDRKNQQQGYSFRGIDDVYNAISGLMAEHHLCMLPRHGDRALAERQSNKGGELFYVTVRSEFELVCSLDGSKCLVVTYGEAMDSGDKATNKAMAAAHKYACIQVFCIPTKGDNDADATTHETTRPQNGAKQPSQTSQAPQGSRNQSPQSAGKTSDAPMKPTTAWITEATHKRLEGFRKTEEGEQIVQRLLAHWKLKDFNELTETEALKAVSWISSELKANGKSPSNNQAA